MKGGVYRMLTFREPERGKKDSKETDCPNGKNYQKEQE